MPIFVGIDPGLSGAWAAIDARERPIRVADMPLIMSGSGKATVKKQINPLGLAGDLASLDSDGKDAVIVALERTSAMPGQGVASMFSMGDTYGAIRAVVALKRFRCEHVTPAAWKKVMGLPADKEVCRARAIAAFPDAEAYLRRVKDHNRAEALMLALWLKRQLS